MCFQTFIAHIKYDSDILLATCLDGFLKQSPYYYFLMMYGHLTSSCYTFYSGLVAATGILQM